MLVQQEMMNSSAVIAQKDDSQNGMISRDRMVQKRAGKQNVAIRVYFEVTGRGEFRAGDFDTTRGTCSAWFKPQSVISLEARPAPGHKFSHWIVANDFSGSSRVRRVVASRGMVIKAVFVPLTSQDIKC